MDGSTPRDERNKEGDLDFDEELDESILQHKHVVVNRSPIMMAWATIVCEQLNFSREEALSIGACSAVVALLVAGLLAAHDSGHTLREADAAQHKRTRTRTPRAKASRSACCPSRAATTTRPARRSRTSSSWGAKCR